LGPTVGGTLADDCQSCFRCLPAWFARDRRSPKSVYGWGGNPNAFGAFERRNPDSNLDYLYFQGLCITCAECQLPTDYMKRLPCVKLLPLKAIFGNSRLEDRNANTHQKSMEPKRFNCTWAAGIGVRWVGASIWVRDGEDQAQEVRYKFRTSITSRISLLLKGKESNLTNMIARDKRRHLITF